MSEPLGSENQSCAPQPPPDRILHTQVPGVSGPRRPETRDAGRSAAGSESGSGSASVSGQSCSEAVPVRPFCLRSLHRLLARPAPCQVPTRDVDSSPFAPRIAPLGPSGQPGTPRPPAALGLHRPQCSPETSCPSWASCGRALPLAALRGHRLRKALEPRAGGRGPVLCSDTPCPSVPNPIRWRYRPTCVHIPDVSRESVLFWAEHLCSTPVDVEWAGEDETEQGDRWSKGE